ncbi:MAG: CsgG/HfaB family protein [Gemmatimonadaceae bacterium]|nr:CsgG/HfaB family protein [Gemmatimonadaceae bacterium]
MRLFKSLLALSALAAPALALQAQGKPTLAVVYFNNGAIGKANEELQPLSKGIADMLITELAANTGIRVVERDQLQAALTEQKMATDGKLDPSSTVKVGKILGAQHTVTGGFITDRTGTMVITVRVFSNESSEIVYTTKAQDKSDNLLLLISKTAAQINKDLKLPPIPARVGEARQEAAKKAPYEAVLLYSRAISAKDKGDKAGAVALFTQSLAKFPEFDKAKDELKKLGS